MNTLASAPVLRAAAVTLAVALVVVLAPVSVGTAEARSAGNVEHIARDLLNRLNDERRARGIAEVGWDADLAHAATVWSARMSDTKAYQHSDMNATLASAPYRDRFSYIGENIYLLYARYESSGYAHRGWMQSEVHRRNMLNRYHDAVGIGIICDADGTMWATMNMGRFHGSSRPGYDMDVPPNPLVHDNAGGPTCRDFNRSASSAPVPVPAPVALPALGPGEFRDVNGGTHAAAIKAIALKGVTEGCTPELYCPRRQITRAQMASLVARARALPATQHSYFSDTRGSPHAAAINALAAAGITGGCGEGVFCPNEPVSRGQMATFIQRAFDLAPPPRPLLSLFGTVRDLFDDVSTSVHRTAINALAHAGISLGCGDGRYCPNDAVSRAEMASFLARALKLV